MSEQMILPSNATPLERALDLGLEGPVLAIPAPIREAKRAYETPAGVLPFLAWERSVDIWDDHWPDATKRAITHRSLKLHKHKGTAYAIREYVRFAGGSVRSIETPPQKVFSGGSLTREQREAWLSRLPQVRSWRMQERGVAPAAKAFYGGALHGHFCETAFSVPSTALSRLKRRVRWVVNGVETETRVSDFGSYFRLHIKAPAGDRVFCNEVMAGGKFFIPSDARKRLVTIQPTPVQPWRTAVGPTLEPVTAEPERVVVRASKGHGVYASDFCGGSFWVPSTAPLRIYERYALNDGTRPVRPAAVQFMGVGRYGFPAHTAHISVSVPGKRHPLSAGDGVLEPSTRFWLPSAAAARVDRVCRAMVAAKRLSDRVLITTGPVPKLIAGNVFRAGEHYIVGRPN